MKNKLKLFGVFSLALLGLTQSSNATFVKGSSAYTNTPLSSVPKRGAKKDAGLNGLIDPKYLGYKDFVFRSSDTVTPAVLTDELGNAVTCGILHQVITSQGLAPTAASLMDWVILVDTAPAFAANVSAATQPRLPPAVRAATSFTTQTYDLQFDSGIVLLDVAQSTGEVHVQWSPCAKPQE